MKYLLTLAGFVSMGLFAQTFEAASIHVLPPPEPGQGITIRARGGPGSPDPTMFSCTNCPMRILVQRAYDLQEYLVTGIDGGGDHLYNVDARIAEGATKAQFLAMLQNLLADRFKLAAHRASKELPAFELSVAKNGPKFKPTRFTEQRGSRLGFETGKMTMHAESQSMDQLVQVLSGTLHAPVINATGLAGNSDFDMTWDGATPDHPSLSTDPDTTQPTIFGALESQLGLKLEKKKATLDVLVVERFNSVPSEN